MRESVPKLTNLNIVKQGLLKRLTTNSSEVLQFCVGIQDLAFETCKEMVAVEEKE